MFCILVFQQSSNIVIQVRVINMACVEILQIHQHVIVLADTQMAIAQQVNFTYFNHIENEHFKLRASIF